MAGRPILLMELMEAVPPVHREMDDRDVDHADQGQDRRGPGCAPGIVDAGLQGHVAQIQEEQDVKDETR